MPGTIMNFAAPPRPDIVANCAVCGAPESADCGHEDNRVEIALNQAMQQWRGYRAIREWCLEHTRAQVLRTYEHLRTLRLEAHHAAMISSSPYYSLYVQYNGKPPLTPAQIHMVQEHMRRADAQLQAGIDADWRTACKQYPTIFEYYFNLVDVALPANDDPIVADPRFGGHSASPGGAVIMMRDYDRDDDHHSHHHRSSGKKERRRGVSPSLPPVPLAPGGSYRR